MENNSIANLTKQDKSDLLKILRHIRTVKNITGHGNIAVQIFDKKVTHFKTTITEVNKQYGKENNKGKRKSYNKKVL